MEWDKFKMAQRFLQRANAIHPEEVHDAVARAEAMARQDLYYDCYMSSFGREELLKRLVEVIDGKIEMPEEVEVDEARYRKAYIKEARAIAATIESGGKLF